jgi:O-antigen ligase
VALLLLVFLALSRWLPGSDPLKPETSGRGMLQVVFLLAAAVLVVIFYGIKEPIQAFKFPAFVILLGYSLWAGVTALWAPSLSLAGGQAFSLLLIVVVTAALAQQLVKHHLAASTVILCALGIMVAFLLVVNLFAYGDLFPMRDLNGRPRMYLGYDHPNGTSIYLAIFIFLCLVTFFKMKKLWQKGLLVLAALAAAGLLWLSGSRTSILALLLCGFIYIAFILPNWRARLAYLGTGLVLAAAGTVLLLTKFSGAAFFDTQTLDSRVKLWQSVFAIMPAWNVFGTGFFSSRFFDLVKWDWAFYTHNSFVEAIFGTGFIGIAFIVAFLVSIWKIIARPGRNPVFFCFFLFALLESNMEVELFFPTMLMAAFTLLLFEHLFTQRLSADSVPAVKAS